MQDQASQGYRPAFAVDTRAYERSSRRNEDVRRLCDIVHLCIQRGDHARAHRAFNLLCRCPHFSFLHHWETATLLFARDEDAHVRCLRNVLATTTQSKRHKRDPIPVFNHLIATLVRYNRLREAITELELVLHSPPYITDPILHLYAGMLTLRMALPAGAFTAELPPISLEYTGRSLEAKATRQNALEREQRAFPSKANIDILRHQSPNALRDARRHFSHSAHLDPDGLAPKYLAAIDQKEQVRDSDSERSSSPPAMDVD